MSEERSSSLKLWVAASDMMHFSKYLGLFGLSLRIASFTRHGGDLKILLIIIDEEIFVWSKCGDLQNIWSMRVQDFFELRVGVILGKKYCHTSGRKIPQISLFHLFVKIIILNSPTIAVYLFSFWIVLIMGEISSINLSILALLLLLCGGLWMLPIVIGRRRFWPETSMNRPSQKSDWVYIFRSLYVHSSCWYMISLPCLVHLLLWWIYL